MTNLYCLLVWDVWNTWSTRASTTITYCINYYLMIHLFCAMAPPNKLQSLIWMIGWCYWPFSLTKLVGLRHCLEDFLYLCWSPDSKNIALSNRQKLGDLTYKRGWASEILHQLIRWFIPTYIYIHTIYIYIYHIYEVIQLFIGFSTCFKECFANLRMTPIRMAEAMTRSTS